MKYFLTCFLACLCLYASAQTNVRTPVSSEGDAIQFNSHFESSALGTSAILEVIPSGDDIEGDYHAAPIFNPSSNYCWVAHRTTNNVSIVDIENEVLIDVVETGALPTDIAFTDKYALVACRADRRLQVFSAETRALIASVDLSGTPLNVEVSGDGRRAIVALDDVQEAAVLNLDDFSVERVLPGFNSGLVGFSFITSNTRSSFSPSVFALSNNGQWAVNSSDQGMIIFNLEDGTSRTITETPDVLNFKFTEDDQSIIAVHYNNAGSVYQVDVATGQVLAKVSPTVPINWASGRLAMSSDGARILLPSTNSAVYIRMDVLDYEMITTNSAVFWTDISADGSVGVAGGFNTYLMDMETGDLVASTTGISLNQGASSPDGTMILAMDPLRRERAEIYLTSNSNIFKLEPTMLGSELEADATYSVEFTPDGKKIIAVNSLSGTVSIIDVVTKSVEKIIPLSWYEIYHAGISPNGNWAIVGERLGDIAGIIDLKSQELIAEIPTFGDRPDQAIFHPSGEKAYVLNAGSTDNISVVDFTQSPPKTTANIVSGNMGISWTNYGIRTNLAISKNGERGVLATPFDNEIQLIDTENDIILESFQVDEFPLRTVLSDEIDGRVYAATTIRNGGKLWIAEDILNDPVIFGGLEVGDNPTQLAYNPNTQLFAVISSSDATVNMVDPAEFEVVEEQRFDAHLIPIAVAFSENNDQFTLCRSIDPLLPNELWINDESQVELPGVPCQYMSISPDGKLIAIPGLADDEVYLIDAEVTSSADVVRVSTSLRYTINPNPVSDRFEVSPINTDLYGIDEPDVSLIGMNGKILKSWRGWDSPNMSELSTGTYQLIISQEKVVSSLKLTKL